MHRIFPARDRVENTYNFFNKFKQKTRRIGQQVSPLKTLATTEQTGNFFAEAACLLLDHRLAGAVTGACLFQCGIKRATPIPVLLDLIAGRNYRLLNGCEIISGGQHLHGKTRLRGAQYSITEIAFG
jgi:hypothetical protein